MTRVLLLLLLLACYRGTRSPARPAGPAAPRSLEPIPDGNGGWYAVLAPVALQDEASNAGGLHLTLRLMERGPGMPHWVHLGGHDRWIAMRCTDRFVAHVTRPTHAPAYLDPGWVTLPAYDGELAAVARVEPGDDLADRLERASREHLEGNNVPETTFRDGVGLGTIGEVQCSTR